MSERSAFVTEFIYCDDCCAAVRDVLVRQLGSEWVAPVWRYRIVAGFLGGLAAGDDVETLDLEYEARAAIEEAICHPLRIVVVQDGQGHALLEFKPRSKPGEPK